MGQYRLIMPLMLFASVADNLRELRVLASGSGFSALFHRQKLPRQKIFEIVQLFVRQQIAVWRRIGVSLLLLHKQFPLG
jgi:hypothetical protein